MADSKPSHTKGGQVVDMGKYKIGAAYEKQAPQKPKEPRIVVPIDRGAVEGLIINIPNWKRGQ